MFLGADVELAVHLRNFRNISIRQPTELTLRISITHNDEFSGVSPND
jgi:hypothetical protein